MNAPQAVNRRIVLARRPQGEPVVEDFRLDKEPVPAAGPGNCCCVPACCHWIPTCAGA